MSAGLPTARDPFRQLLRRPGYRGFVLTVSLSRIGAFMFNTAGVLLVLDRTGSAPLAGLTAAAALLPGAFSGPLLGAWLDVSSRRRLLVVVDQFLSMIALVGILLLAGHAPNWTVPLVTVLYSVTRPFSSGAFTSALVEIAGPELLDPASAIEATSLNLAVIIGPAVAGLLVAAVGAATTVEVQIALIAVVAVLIAVNPAFDARPEERPAGLRHALRDGFRATTRIRVLRITSLTSGLAAFGWGLMIVAFPLYTEGTLHARTSASGFLWAALGVGSIVGTFVLRREPSLRRVGASYGALGLSALLWPLASALWVGVGLVILTGVIEGPAYSGSIALRQRHAPPIVRAQVMVTMTSLTGITLAAGSALGGAIHDATVLILILAAVNFVAAATSVGGRRRPGTS